MEKAELYAISQPVTNIHCGIYFLFCGDDIVYVGQSVDVYSRINAHRNSRKEFDRWAFISCPINELYQLEIQFIIKFQPLYNATEWISCGFLSKKPLKKFFNVDGYCLREVIDTFQVPCKGKCFDLLFLIDIFNTYYNAKIPTVAITETTSQDNQKDGKK